MTGYVTLHGGKTWKLPPLLQWSIEATDGAPCGAFSVEFAYAPEDVSALQQATRFYAEQDGARVMTGVVDDVTVRLTKNGRLAEVTGRSLAALLLDTQVRAAEYQSAQLEDILTAYVRPCGVTQIQAQKMGAVGNFVIETGYNCYQVLAGFCRHSADIIPRFAADGTLMLKRSGTGARRVFDGGCVSATYTLDRYGALATQILVNTRNGQQQVAQNAEFQAMGGFGTHVAGLTGQKIRASWRTAQQRIDDGWRGARLLRLTMPGSFLAEPGDLAAVSMAELGIAGTFVVQSVRSQCDDRGALCTMEMRPERM